MNKITKPSNRVVVTDTGKLPDSVGFPGSMKGNTRTLNRTELAIQKKIANHE